MNDIPTFKGAIIVYDRDFPLIPMNKYKLKSRFIIGEKWIFLPMIMKTSYQAISNSACG